MMPEIIANEICELAIGGVPFGFLQLVGLVGRSETQHLDRFGQGLASLNPTSSLEFPEREYGE
jgi:hypothetical protein